MRSAEVIFPLNGRKSLPCARCPANSLLTQTLTECQQQGRVSETDLTASPLFACFCIWCKTCRALTTKPSLPKNSWHVGGFFQVLFTDTKVWETPPLWKKHFVPSLLLLLLFLGYLLKPVFKVHVIVLLPVVGLFSFVVYISDERPPLSNRQNCVWITEGKTDCCLYCLLCCQTLF